MPAEKNQMKIKIKFLSETFTCSVNKDVLGATLLSFVCKRVGTFEPWWFGLQYQDSRKIKTWVLLDKKIGAHDISREGDWALLTLLVKHFPENIQAEVIQTKTLQLFYQQVRQEIMDEIIYCDPGVIVLLAGQHMQYTYGDLAGTEKGQKLIVDNFKKLVPAGLQERHNMSQSDWYHMIGEFWEGCKTQSKNEALKEAMSHVQNLDTYGVNYYEIKNKRKTPLLLGITSQGLNIYKPENRLVPKVCLTWAEIRSIAYNDKKFTIKPIDKNASEFVMYSDHNKENVIIMDLCIERHEMFLARRKPDTPDVLAWKAKAKNEERVTEEKEVVSKKANQSKNNYHATLKKAQKAAVDKDAGEDIQKKLKDDYDSALKTMNDKVSEMEAEKKALEKARAKAESELENLTLDKDSATKEAEAERKQREAIEEERSKAILVAQEKEEEVERLKRELDAFKTKFEEDQKALKQLESDVAKGKKVSVEESSVDDKKAKDAMKKKAEKLTLRMRDRRTKTTEQDSSHEQIVQSGADKFKTLKMLRSGNVRARIDAFETL